MVTVFQQFIDGMRQTGLLEYVAVISGLASVWYSKKEDILLYPIGLLNTTIYIYLSVKAQLYGEASVNFYYTIVSIYGWVVWSRRDERQVTQLKIRSSSKSEWIAQLQFFFLFYIAIFIALKKLQEGFSPGVIPWADALASASAYTGMWLMVRKKLESWYWWILTNISSIPLYFVKGFVFTSVYYLILLVMAFYGLAEWKKKAISNTHV